MRPRCFQELLADLRRFPGVLPPHYYHSVRPFKGTSGSFVYSSIQNPQEPVYHDYWIFVSFEGYIKLVTHTNVSVCTVTCFLNYF